MQLTSEALVARNAPLKVRIRLAVTGATIAWVLAAIFLVLAFRQRTGEAGSPIVPGAVASRR
jgi:hypothetical protein